MYIDAKSGYPEVYWAKVKIYSKYLKIEAKALREAWLNEDIFPTFGDYDNRHRYRYYNSTHFLRIKNVSDAEENNI